MPLTTVVRTAAVPGREPGGARPCSPPRCWPLSRWSWAPRSQGRPMRRRAAVPAAKPPDKPGGTEEASGGGTTELEYAAVGDSFAAGTGAGSYLTGSRGYQKLQEPSEAAGRRRESPSRGLLSVLRLVNGGDRRPGRGDRHHGEGRHGHVGGNDVGFDDVC